MMENAGFMRTTAVCCAIGGVINVVGGIYDTVAPDSFGSQEHLLLLAMNALVLAGLVGLAGSGAAGNSLAGRIALGVALLGQALFVVAEIFGIAGSQATDRLLYSIGTLLNALGMIGVGIVVLRVRRWQGWPAWTPLVWGLYPIVVLLPAIALGGGLVYPALSGLGLCYLLLSFALWQEAGGRKVIQPGRVS